MKLTARQWAIAQLHLVASFDEKALRGDQKIAEFWPGDRVEHLSTITGAINHKTATLQARQMI